MSMSQSFPKLTKAPITEAMFEIAALVEPDKLVSGSQAFHSAIRAEFPESREMRAAEFTMDQESQEASERSISHGTVYWSQARDKAVQARPNGFSLSHVGNYSNWESIREDAQRNWQIYWEKFLPNLPTRCSVRFINRLEIPAASDWADSLNTRPEWPDSLQVISNGLFLRLNCQFEEANATILQASAAQEGDIIPVFLDINVASIDPIVDVAGMWRTFETLRRVKNQCFYSSIKEVLWRKYL
jgi:uncharacterized protein (TIGR04255 family)